MTENVDEISRAEVVAGTISGTATSFQFHAAKAVMLRLPLDVLVHLDEMANKARKSRNVMASDLLRVGIEAVRKELPEPVQDELDERVMIELAHQLELYEADTGSDDSTFGKLKG
jgi:hypothetical protein